MTVARKVCYEAVAQRTKEPILVRLLRETGRSAVLQSALGAEDQGTNPCPSASADSQANRGWRARRTRVDGAGEGYAIIDMRSARRGARADRQWLRYQSRFILTQAGYERNERNSNDSAVRNV